MWYIDDALGREFVHEFFSAATYTFPNSPSAPTTIPIERIRDLYEEMRKQIGVDSLPFDDIMALPGSDERLEKVKEYTTRLGANPSDSLAGHVFINGRYLEYSRSWTHSLQQELTQQVHYLQGLVGAGDSKSDIRSNRVPSRMWTCSLPSSTIFQRQPRGETSSLYLLLTVNCRCSTSLTFSETKLSSCLSSLSILVSR